MSWDVLLMRLPSGVRSLAELPDDFSGESLGTPLEVGKVLRDLFPHIDLSDQSWAVLEADDYSIEFNIGEDTLCTSVMLHVRGPETAIEPIRMVCERTGWSAFDTSGGKLINFEVDPAAGLRAWIAFRQQAGIIGPLRGIALPIDAKGAVDSDARSPAPTKKRAWWAFWR